MSHSMSGQPLCIEVQASSFSQCSNEEVRMWNGLLPTATLGTIRGMKAGNQLRLSYAYANHTDLTTRPSLHDVRLDSQGSPRDALC